MQTTILDKPQREHLAKHGELTLVLPMEQPPEGLVYDYIQEGYVKFTDTACLGGVAIKLQHPVGSRIPVQKEWVRYQVILNIRKPDGRSFDEVMDGEYAYKSDGYEDIADFKDHIRLMYGSDFVAVETEYDGWQPASTMPEELWQWLEVTKCEVKEQDGVYIEEIVVRGKNE